MNDPADLDAAENLHGGFYELAVELGPRDYERLERALQAMWTLAGVDGFMAVVGRDPLNHGDAELSLASLEAHYLHGVVRHPAGERVVCGAISVREESGQDRFDFVLPLGALSRTDPRVGAFPFGDDDGDASLGWRRPIDDWLATLALQLFEVVPFQLALIGFEASGELSASDVVAGIPPEHWWGS